MPARRPGLTLIEVVVVLALAGVIVATIGATLLRQQRFYRGAGELLYARESVRDALEVLSTDIRSVSTADTVPLLADSAIEIFASIGTSVVCQRLPAGEVGLPGSGDPRGNTLTSVLTPPDTGDLAFFYQHSDSDGIWVRRQIAMFGSAALSSACPDSSGLARGAGGKGFTLALSAPLPATIGPGSPVRFARRGRYSLYRASDGEWYLGYRRCNAIGVSVCGAIQPLSGPYRAYSPDPATTGLLFEGFDAGGARVTDSSLPLSLARVDITARAESRQRLPGAGGGWKPADSATVSIAIRNRW